MSFEDVQVGGRLEESAQTMAEASIGYCALGDTVAGLGLANDAPIEVDIVVCALRTPCVEDAKTCDMCKYRC
jgi:hypothetical protein